MTEPLWRAGEKSAYKKAMKLAKKKRRSKFVVEYNLTYDGGECSWNGYYRTYFGARLAAFWNLHFLSWGGQAELFSYPKPVPPPTVGPEGRKKGIFSGR